MSIEEMKRRKAELGYTNEQIAQLSGVPLSTVQKIFAGITAQPRYDTLMALERVLRQRTDRVGEPGFEYKAGSGAGAGMKKQGEYTVKDYYSITGDGRAELIDGVIYYLSAPSGLHQTITAKLYMMLDSYIEKKKGDCFTGIAPYDVDLLVNNSNLVQPDVFVVCDRDKITKQEIKGAPDFVIEVLSEKNRKNDLVKKYTKYEEAGVREYWIIDPETQKVIVYIFEDDRFPKIYGFGDQIPVYIFGDDCVIDMNEIYEKVKFYYEL